MSSISKMPNSTHQQEGIGNSIKINQAGNDDSNIDETAIMMATNGSAALLTFLFVFLIVSSMVVKQLRIFIQLLCTVFYYIICGCIKSILPSGVLPRKSVKGKLVLITGSGSGIGRLMALKLGKLGARIILWDINEEMNIETRKMLDDLGVESKAYKVDLSVWKQIYAVAAEVKRDMGDPDILVNNAGIVSGKKLFECPEELMEKTMAINCNALFYTTKSFLPGMMNRREGHIVNISSLAGVAGVSGLVDYCASKHGAVGFSEALRAEMIEMDLPITVTTVCPYYINTGMFGGVKTYSPRLFPILEPQYVVDRIVEAILTDTDELFLPWTSNLVLALKGILPTKAVIAIGNYYGFNKTMDTWTGRQQQKSITETDTIMRNGVH